MNTGIQDACFLSSLFGAAADRNAISFESYQASRRPVAEGVVTLTDKLTRLATMKGPLKRSARNAAIRVLNLVPAFKSGLATQLAEIRSG